MSARDEIIICMAAFFSGIAIETLYAAGVIVISERRAGQAAWLSAAWGVAFLVGVNESFRSNWAAAVWCIGLGIGAALGVWFKRRKKRRKRKR